MSEYACEAPAMSRPANTGRPTPAAPLRHEKRPCVR
jgi:hypothetical protein